MPSYTVTAVNGTTPKPDGGYGPMQEINMDLSDGSQTYRGVNWFTKAATPLPQAGQSIEFEPLIEDPKWGWKARKPKNQNGGGGFRSSPMDPAREKKIVRQHSQAMAIAYCDANGRVLASIEDLKPIIDWFDADVFGPAQTLEQAVAALPVTPEKIPF